MKKLLFVIPTRLCDDGALKIKNFRGLKVMLGYLKESCDITLTVRVQRNKCIPELDNMGIPIFYDNSPQKNRPETGSSRFRNSYDQWAERERMGLEYDCLIAWDGCSPWCLATALTCASAKRRILWLHDAPDLYLMRKDHEFYSVLCKQFDSTIVPDEVIKNSLENICAGIKCETIRLPVDSAWCWEQSEKPCECRFRDDEINLLAFSRMSIESVFECLPAWLSRHQKLCQSWHCYLFGTGERFDRYIQQIAIYSTDDVFTLLGDVGSPYPYIRGCDVLLVCKDERQPDMETAAEVFGVPVILFEELEQRFSEIKKRKKPENMPMLSWQDKDRLVEIVGVN